MHITKEELLTEVASLDQQEAQWRETVARADAVKANALAQIEAVGGAKQAVNHLLNKIKLKEQSNGCDRDNRPTDGGDAGDEQEAPSDAAAGSAG